MSVNVSFVDRFYACKLIIYYVFIHLPVFQFWLALISKIIS